MPTYAPERDRARKRAWGALFVREEGAGGYRRKRSRKEMIVAGRRPICHIMTSRNQSHHRTGLEKPSPRRLACPPGRLARSVLDAAKQIAPETGESPDAVDQKIRRGMKEVRQVVAQQQPAETTTETPKSNEIKREPAKGGTRTVFSDVSKKCIISMRQIRETHFKIGDAQVKHRGGSVGLGGRVQGVGGTITAHSSRPVPRA